MNILVANDDGINADGIKFLAQKLTSLGDVTVVAPKHHQSGKGHATSFGQKIEIEKVDFDNGIEAYSVDGTPRDCVYFALNGLCNKKFDLIVTGINQGSNVSNDCVASGTCGSACVGLMYNIPAIAFSLDFGDTFDYNQASIIALDVTKWYLKAELPTSFIINCNIPNIPLNDIKGWKVVSDGVLHLYHNDLKFITNGSKIIADTSTLKTETMNIIENLDCDEYALRQGYVTLQPVNTDLTDYSVISMVNDSLQMQV